MKKNRLLAFLLSTLTLTLFAQQRIAVKFSFDGIEREFFVAKPSGATPAGGYPVVFVFHGTGGDGDNFYTKSGWKEKAELEKFIAVFPSAINYCVVEGNQQVRIAKWMNGGTVSDLCPNVTQTLKDDVKFTRKIVDTLKKTLSINPKKIYAAGFSNGAAMTAKLATETTDIFAAFACSSSVLNALDTVNPTLKRPLWFVIGTQDDKFIRSPWLEIPYDGDSSLSYFNAPLNRFLNAAGLTNTYTKTTAAKFLTYAYTTPKAGEKSNIFKYTLVKDMPHMYPNGDNHPISSANIFWEFFNQFSLTSSTETLIENQNLIAAYPNPSNAEMTLDLSAFSNSSKVEIAVFNVVGKQVFSLKSSYQKNFVLKKDQIGKGLFFVKISVDNQWITKKVVFE